MRKLFEITATVRADVRETWRVEADNTNHARKLFEASEAEHVGDQVTGNEEGREVENIVEVERPKGLQLASDNRLDVLAGEVLSSTDRAAMLALLAADKLRLAGALEVDVLVAQEFAQAEAAFIVQAAHQVHQELIAADLLGVAHKIAERVL